MIRWGFSISKDNQIDFDRNDKGVANLIRQMDASFNLCIGCGACTASCSTGSFTNYNTRKLRELLKRGEMDEVKEKIGLCMLCGKCHLVCPRGVNTRNISLKIREEIEKIYNHEVRPIYPSI